MRRNELRYRSKFVTVISVFIFLYGILCLPATLLAVEAIKFATYAPKGSTWMNNFDAMAKEISKNTDGQIKFQFFANGIQGDELDVIRKMRTGLIHAGAMTATGLGEINEEVLIFQLPRLFKNYEELDYVRDYLLEDLDKVFLEKGYILIGMGDIGFYYIFSNQPIKTIADLQSPSVKMWVRTSDKIGIEFFKRANIATVPREVNQVLQALHSGQLNTITASPYVTIALQWHDKFKYMTKLPVNAGVGAIVITKEKFDQFTPDQQKALREAGKKYMKLLIQDIRKDNDRAVEALTQKAGIKVVEFEDDATKTWDTIATDTHQALIGDIYSQEFLDKINGLLKDYRAKK